MEKELLKKISEMADAMRMDIVKMAYNCGGNAHLGGGLSIVEILAVLYGAILKYDITNPEWPERDRFVLSKGHGVLGFYAALHQTGFLSTAQLDTFQANDTELGAHPVRNPVLGIESSNGSLGQGLSFCAGMALAAKLRGGTYRVFTLLGNGECNEGSVWEAVMSAAQYRLDNLVMIIDDNRMQSDGLSTDIMNISPFEDKLRSFGWNVHIVDGHDVDSLYRALTIPAADAKPTAVVAKTIKGKGFTFTENMPEWHHNRMTEKYYNQAMEELAVTADV